MKTITSVEELKYYITVNGGIVNANVDLRDKPYVTKLPEGLEEVRGQLDLQNCPRLTSLPKSLRKVTDHFHIYDCPNLKSLGGLQEAVSTLDLQRCTALKSLGQLEVVNGELFLSGCTGLKSLRRLRKVSKTCRLDGCVSLKSLARLESVGDNLSLAGCTRLKNMGNLKKVGNSLDLRGCTSLKTLGGLESVGTFGAIGGTFHLEGLTELRSLGNLKRVSGHFNLHGCTGLRSLGKVEKVGGYLRLFGCTGLTGDLAEYLHYAPHVERYRDERERLHCENGPAAGSIIQGGVEYRWNDSKFTQVPVDGNPPAKVDLEYRWHGVSVPEYVICSPEQITIADIHDTKNAEVKRVKIVRYGMARYMQDSNSELLDDDQRYGKLWRMRVDGRAVSVLMLEVLNSTAEPDGTYKTYWIPVRPTCTGNPKIREGSPMDTAYKAVWSTFPIIWGLGIAYDPKVET